MRTLKDVADGFSAGLSLWPTSPTALFLFSQTLGRVAHRLPSTQANRNLPFQTLQFVKDWSGARADGRGSSMSTDQEPTLTVKLLQLVLLSTYWGMQIWVTFISSWYQVWQQRHTDTRIHTLSSCALKQVKRRVALCSSLSYSQKLREVCPGQQRG